jgi:hypothetical protein
MVHFLFKTRQAYYNPPGKIKLKKSFVAQKGIAPHAVALLKISPFARRLSVASRVY